MRAVDIIQKKRDGAELEDAEIRFMIEALGRATVEDYQLTAWMMAIFLRGMNERETATLTEAILRSGVRLDLSSIPGTKVDKHSTGGVGDKTSLILAPVVAAGGVIVPMISGRGLGHTGGTVDKLEAIPGFNAFISIERFRELLKTIGVGLIGQTAELAPADKKLYALRDVTATIESIPLIVGSIMGKKLAEGIDALVLDVKTGSGAFMSRLEDARRLAQAMVTTGNRFGVRTVALITRMDEPLGRCIGNALEVEECIDVLKGDLSGDLAQLSLELSAWMLHLGKAAESVDEGRRKARELIASGRALEKFRQIIHEQEGDARIVDQPTRLPQATLQEEYRSKRSGVVQRIHARTLGEASMMLGGGRETAAAKVDHAVGLRLLRKRGENVSKDEPLCRIYYNDPDRRQGIERHLNEAFEIGEAIPADEPLIEEVIGGDVTVCDRAT
ncbi:MAG: thymidine phosphorylase [Acidobacteriota bacterium]